LGHFCSQRVLKQSVYTFKYCLGSAFCDPFLPVGSSRPFILGNAGRVHFDTNVHGISGTAAIWFRKVGTANEPVALLGIDGGVVSTLGVDGTRSYKMLVQMIHELEDVALHGAGDGNVINQAGWKRLEKESIPSIECQVRALVCLPKMDNIFAQAYTPCVGTYRNTKSIKQVSDLGMDRHE